MQNEHASSDSAEIFTPAEAAKLFDPPVHPTTVYRLVYAGKLRVLDHPRILIPRSEIEKFTSRLVDYVPRKLRRKEVA
jgi:hypothetical protein